MVSEVECMSLILSKFPGFQKDWQEHLEWWGNDKAGLGNEMSCFSRYVIELLKESDKHEEELNSIFTLIEDFMIKGTQDLQDVAATCFLENLINATSWGTISALTFVNMLGKESKEYCIAWDEFTGVKTEGLYEK